MADTLDRPTIITTSNPPTRTLTAIPRRSRIMGRMPLRMAMEYVIDKWERKRMWLIV